MEENRKKVPFYNQIEKYMIVSMFLVMTVIIALNVVTRFVFNFTLSWGEQLARLLLVWTSFAGISWAGIFETIYFLGDIVAVIYGFYLSWQIFGVMMLVKNQGQVLSALPLVPKWIMYLAGVLGMAGMSIRIIQRRVGEFCSTEQE